MAFRTQESTCITKQTFALRSAGTWGGFGTISPKSDVRIFAGNAVKLTIKENTGNIGIGLTNPSEKLEVYGSIKSLALAGNGSSYVCANSVGKMYRSNGYPCETFTEYPELSLISAYAMNGSGDSTVDYFYMKVSLSSKFVKLDDSMMLLSAGGNSSAHVFNDTINCNNKYSMVSGQFGVTYNQASTMWKKGYLLNGDSVTVCVQSPSSVGSGYMSMNFVTPTTNDVYAGKYISSGMMSQDIIYLS